MVHRAPLEHYDAALEVLWGDPGEAYGRCISTGGYHSAMAAPALDDLAPVWADICLLCDRHSNKLLDGRVSQ